MLPGYLIADPNLLYSDKTKSFLRCRKYETTICRKSNVRAAGEKTPAGDNSRDNTASPPQRSACSAPPEQGRQEWIALAAERRGAEIHTHGRRSLNATNNKQQTRTKFPAKNYEERRKAHRTTVKAARRG
jgi:hypothetical protein